MLRMLQDGLGTLQLSAVRLVMMQASSVRPSTKLP